ncbi:MAG: insulinase family protein [Deltaproteobacteria bacterium]|nr:insulinase family protein [Deltaproteobacteria bacterium]
MKTGARLFPPFLLALISFCSFLSAASAASPLQETLSNGLKVFVLGNPGTASVSVDLWVKAGSRYESPPFNGISHFVEHLLFKGTSQRTAKDISREIAAVGGLLNGYTHWEYTQIHISLTPLHLGLALEILGDIAQNSLLTDEMIGKERKVLLEEISLGSIYPPSYVLNLVSKTLFPGNSLGMPISGTKDTVTAMQRQDLRQFYKRHYVPNNTLLTIIGNIDSHAALANAREKFESWPMGDSLPSPFSPPWRQNELKKVRERKFLDQAIVVVALRAMGLRDPDRPTFEIINAILGSGGHSRLYQEIREKRGLSYLVGSLYHPLSDTGLWATYADTDPKNIKQVQSLIFQEFRKIREEPLSPRELEEIKSYIQGRTLIRHETNVALADFIGPRLLAGSGELPGEFLRKVQAVSAEDVMRVARNCLREDQFNIIILRPYPGLRLFRGLF